MNKYLGLLVNSSGEAKQARREGLFIQRDVVPNSYDQRDEIIRDLVY